MSPALLCLLTTLSSLPQDSLSHSLNILTFIRLTSLVHSNIWACWTALRLTIWSYEEFTPSMKEIEMLNDHGCNNAATLSDLVMYKVVWYSLQYGVLPIHVTSTYCYSCFHQCHHNYVVRKDNNACMYYGDVPKVIQVAMHFFIDNQVLEMFATAKVFGWLSSLNRARIYNESVSNPYSWARNKPAASKYPSVWPLKAMLQGWPFTLKMQDVDVLNVFFIYSLLVDKFKHREQLVFLHDTTQRDFAVCDGITIGHPCYAVQDCKIPLDNLQKRYCSDHEGQALLYAIKACIYALGITIPADSLEVGVSSDKNTTSNSDMGHDEDQAVFDCDGKSEEGNHKLRAQFRLRRTHNEQFIMQPCGVILPAVSAVNVSGFTKAVFSTTDSTPEYCHFAHTRMPVNVFHFKSKHKETNNYCQQHCNPASFPEFIQDGKWQFNISICRQTNVWLGGYQAILCDMSVHQYNFYSDEMVKRRNQFIIQQLEKEERRPEMVSRYILFPTN
ncbi:hypothetical protein PAXINDRAFT_164184 [Paxillus involutus ATCC 200175]|uniref:Uncharacterized protein n=1 Tax=Paxillus involutus ATCC 200175 TaxID=664439 RepID=A0A0C9TUX9_PAXIN|nr:hypothetical protein PAXINDRAFT_164184 [Paxillus involutus ATCC 200175]